MTILIKQSTIETFREVLKKKQRDFKVIVNISGGKDSTFLLDLCLRYLGPKNIDAIVYIEVPGNTHQLNVELVHKIIDYYNNFFDVKEKFVHIKKPGCYCHEHREIEDFWTYMQRHAEIPYCHKARWCMYKMKFNYLGEFIEEMKWPKRKIVTIAGIKLSDSKFRKSRYQEYVGKLMPGAIQSHEWVPYGYFAIPILEYTTSEIWSYLKIVVPELYNELKRVYDEYGDTLNCIFCPFKDKSTIQKHARHDDIRRFLLEKLSKIEPKKEQSRKVKERWMKILKAPNLEIPI
ncbi:hypothetical protein DRJ17_04140 [Candidatus Woesearchaeota archaeon]|nr:MAG: hypothetical protein DRJ17_04140 [Candidatus Woesearchaeota archaeon]